MMSEFGVPSLVVRTVLVLPLLFLAACSSSSERLSDPTSPGMVEPTPAAPSPTTMRAGDIMRILSGNSFRFTRGSRTGTTTFNADGTFSYQENGKGEGTGIWQASDGSLCEAFNPTSFLPRGTRTECHPFTQTAEGSYSSGDALYEAM